MITIIDYGLGNLTSVKGALDKLNISSQISSDISEIEKADALILPGVGAAGEGMKNLKDRKLVDLIIQEVKAGKPFLGICLGMQLMLGANEEGNIDGLNIINGTVKKFESDLKIPQIGWNQVATKPSRLFQEIKEDSYFYFVHSYYCQPEGNSVTVGTTEYGLQFCSAIENGNIFGVQFHPEKSGDTGLQVLKNFYSTIV